MLNVTLDLVKPAKQINYTIMNSLAQHVATEIRHNVQNEVFTYSTANLPAGNYYIAINADGKQAFKKFTVIK